MGLGLGWGQGQGKGPSVPDTLPLTTLLYYNLTILLLYYVTNTI